jgi:hypothetical protein
MSRSEPSTTSGPPPPATPAKKSSPEELAALRQTFNALDTRHRGKIDARALSVLCKEIGIPTDVAPLVAMVFDQDRMKPRDELAFWTTETYRGLTIHAVGS